MPCNSKFLSLSNFFLIEKQEQITSPENKKIISYACYLPKHLNFNWPDVYIYLLKTHGRFSLLIPDLNYI